MNYTTSEPDAVYIAGRIVALILFPFIVYGVCYLIIRLTRKRKPTPKEKKIIIIVAVVLVVISILAKVGRAVSEQY